MEQFEHSLADRPGIGHNQPPEPIDPIAALTARLTAGHADLVARFRDLEVGCARVPDPIGNDEEAALATDFIAQCQLHIRTAEAKHKEEKEFFLKAGRVIDGFFKRRCQSLGDALVPVMTRLKTYRDAVAEAERRRHEAGRQAAEAEARRAEAEAAECRDRAERLAREAQTAEDRRRAAEELALADMAEERVAEAGERLRVPLEPTRIRGDNGATAYVSRSWTFDVVDLDQVPRAYLSLDAQLVREAITRDGVRHISGLRIYQMEALRVKRA